MGHKNRRKWNAISIIKSTVRGYEFPLTTACYKPILIFFYKTVLNQHYVNLFLNTLILSTVKQILGNMFQIGATRLKKNVFKTNLWVRATNIL